jgi:ATP-dependent Clp protease protease subunit
MADEIHEMLLGRRIVRIREPIDERIAAQTIAKLLYLARADRSAALTVVVNCSGGLLDQTLAIAYTIRYIPAPVHTHCVGCAGGGAAIIAASGRRGYRTAELDAEFAFGSVETPDLHEREFIPSDMEHLIDLLAGSTRQSRERIGLDLMARRRFSSSEAVSYGLIDSIRFDDELRRAGGSEPANQPRGF